MAAKCRAEENSAIDHSCPARTTEFYIKYFPIIRYMYLSALNYGELNYRWLQLIEDMPSDYWSHLLENILHIYRKTNPSAVIEFKNRNYR